MPRRNAPNGPFFSEHGYHNHIANELLFEPGHILSISIHVSPLGFTPAELGKSKDSCFHSNQADQENLPVYWTQLSITVNNHRIIELEQAYKAIKSNPMLNAGM